MVRLRSNTKYFIIGIMFIVSIFIGLERSRFLKSFRQTAPSINLSDFQKTYDKASNSKKIKMVFNVEEISAPVSELNGILSEYNIFTKNSDSKSNYTVSILEFPDSLFTDVMSDLREIKGLTEEKVKTPEDVSFDIDIEEHLNNKVIVRERIKESLKNPRLNQDSIERLRFSLNSVQTSIDSLNNRKTIQERNRTFNLLFLTILQKSGRTYTAMRIAKSFGIFLGYFLIYMVAFTIFLFFLFFMMDFILKLMTKLGLRTARGTSKGYNYSYGSYGRKVKRVYKGKKEKETEKKE
ncbi:MAG: hypothetical protein HQ534_05975 [Armatimonadetes bacterium]|nr:hypothetical protein [Armatimonadota bacterium]